MAIAPPQPPGTDTAAISSTAAAVPAVQALTYSISEAHIRDLFANLLAADMNIDTKSNAHPAFVEIIKEMTPADAKVLGVLQKSSQVEFRVRYGSPHGFREVATHYSFEVDGVSVAETATSLSNLQRLGLADTMRDEAIISDEVNEKENQARMRYQHMCDRVEQARKEFADRPELLAQLSPHGAVFITRSGMYLTPLGIQFVYA
jgi:hypothetical protein